MLGACGAGTAGWIRTADLLIRPWQPSVQGGHGNRLTLRVLISDWNRLHLASRRPTYAAEAVRALHYAFADYLDDPAAPITAAAASRAFESATAEQAPSDSKSPQSATGRHAPPRSPADLTIPLYKAESLETF